MMAYYGVFSTSELRPRALNMTFFNAGYMPATNVVAHITTSDGYDESGSLGTVAPGDSVTWFGPLWTPSESPGDHTIHYGVTSDDPDADTTNNTGTAKIKVSDYYYARDNGARTGEVGGGENGDAFRVGNWMHAQVDEYLTSILVAFSSNSAVGLEVNAQVLDHNRDLIAESMNYTIMTSDLSPMGSGHFVSFCFDMGIELTAGSDHFVLVQHFGGANVLVATSGLSEPQSSMLYKSTDSTWYSISSTPMVNMSFALPKSSCDGAVEEVDGYGAVGLGQCIPDPVLDNATVEISLGSAMHVSLTVHDLSGKLMRTVYEGTLSPGKHKVAIDTRGLSNGIYTYSLSTMNSESTKRMVVVH